MVPLTDLLIASKWLALLYLCCFWGSLLFIKSGSGAYSLLRYSVGKAFGLIGVAALSWLLSIYKIMPFSASTIIILLSVLYAVVLYFRWNNIINALKNDRLIYIKVELIFLALFIFGIVLRASIPKIDGIEKFMDVAILSNLMRHGGGGPGGGQMPQGGGPAAR
jgi:hypothetical protein